jgi:S1-C subfamily serine protease
VISRNREADTTLIRLTEPPPGLAWLPAGRSAGLGVGDFLFVSGVAFDENESALPTVTSGIVASTDTRPERGSGGARDFLYTTAAVNQGVGGGPVVDLDGHLVGTVSSWIDPEPDAPHQMLGQVVPIDRIRRVHASDATPVHIPVYRARAVAEGDPARALETSIHDAAVTARKAVVSLDVQRSDPVSSVVPTAREGTSLPRWQGPVSGLLVSDDGWIVASLYDFTNVGELVFPTWPAPPGASVEEGMRAVRSVRAWLWRSASGPARIVSYDERWGLVLLKVAPEVVRASEARPLEPAPAEAFGAGRFTVAVGDPFGARRRELPIVTFGMLSKEHWAEAPVPWRGEWQTDASGLDVNAGGPVVGIDGRLLGMMQIWYPARHGRHSGVAFVVPWHAIRRALPGLKRGQRPRRGLLGVTFSAGNVPRIGSVAPESSASRAGFVAGDVIVRVGGQDVATADDVVAAIGVRFEGERLEIGYERDGTPHAVTVRLGAR